MEPGAEQALPPVIECASCGHHFQIDPRGDVEEGCPDCGRPWKEQVPGEPSDGRLKNMPEPGDSWGGTNADPGGNPEGTGIRDSVLAYFGEHYEYTHPCPLCGQVGVHHPGCDYYGVADYDDYGTPALQNPETRGDPDAQGVAMDGGKASLPLDTPGRGRDDGQNHAHIHAHRDMWCPYCKQPSVDEEGWCPNCERNLRPEEQHPPIPKAPNYMIRDPSLEQKQPNFIQRMFSGTAIPVMGAIQQDSCHFPLQIEGAWGHWLSTAVVADADSLRAIFQNGSQTEMGERARRFKEQFAPKEDALEVPPKPEGPVPRWEPPLPPQISKCRNCKHPVDVTTGECPNCGQMSLIARQSGDVKDEMRDFDYRSRMEPYASPFHEAGFLAPLAEGLAGAGAEAAGAGAAGAGEAGAAAAGSGGLTAPQVGGLMQGVMGGGQPQQQQPPQEEQVITNEPQQTFGSILDAFMGHYETPASNPDVGSKRGDDPEQVDQKEFNDQDHSPKNVKNPETGEPGGVTTGEDNAVSHDTPFKHDGEDTKSKDGDGSHEDVFAPDSPAIERLQMLMPLLLHFFNSDESGANDPMVKGLHEMLEQEHPGYMDKGDPSHAQILIETMAPKHAVVENAGQAGEAPEMVPPAEGAALGVPTATQQQQAELQAAALQEALRAQQPSPFAQQPQQQPQQPPQNMLGQPQQPPRMSNHMGPETPQQIAAVQELLIQEGRVDEVPNVALEPFRYDQELRKIQRQPNIAPDVTQQEQTPPPPPPAPPGQEGMQGAPGPQGEGNLTAPMAHIASDEENDSLLFGFVLAADNVAGACPNCGSHTTGVTDGAGNQHCHACKHTWKQQGAESDADIGSTSIAHTYTAAPFINEPEPTGEGAAEEASPVDMGPLEQVPQDNGLTWQTTSGEPLQPGQTYVMKSTQYPVPDMVKIMRVKPDGLEVNLMGAFGDQPDPLGHTEHISREEMQAEGLTFEPLPMGADQRQQKPEPPPPGRAAPGTPPVQQTTDERDNSFGVESSVQDDRCTKCGHRDGERLANGNSVFHTSEMISSIQSEHECSFCGNHWITKEEEESVGLHRTGDGNEWENPSAQWIFDDDDSWSDTDRMRMMAAAAHRSRNIGDIPRDKRSQEIKEHLDKQAALRKEGGRYFSPLEQRGLIDEGGVARNSDLLQLDNTHYKTSTEESKLDPERVPLEHIIMGL